MKAISFSALEVSLLKKHIEQRLAHYSKVKNESSLSAAKWLKRRHEDPLASALSKILSGQPSLYSTWQKSLCSGCINEHMEDYYILLGKKEMNEWINLTVQEMELVQTIDSCKDILSKMGFYQEKSLFRIDTSFRYRHALDVLTAVKQAPLIAASECYGQVSEVAFVCSDTEYFHVSLNHEVRISDFNFSTVSHTTAAEHCRSRYATMIESKSATPFLEKLQSAERDAVVIELVQHCLSKNSVK